ncbi:methyltransferase type 12 [Mangrovactinospora gilvigrisea]|uniref:Methyltransferase type 12 n=1 Tax=Mangrovactinospora gilvigrisea TaxID=1428644 RepID=A0A1J7BDA1_9ACTN|nr:class I SAM-dependent methyltransferase [Mangrovactinospora gilvigrisea]OIV36659.1 methyltransferase type 12 [Mangrovactinospora gilvigrisea]
MRPTLEYTALNRVGWERIAPDRHPQSPEFYTAGGSTLSALETDFLPEVRGKRMLHLACANGNDSLSWAARGASVTGVDLVASAVETANRTADAAGLDARFLAADVYRLPEGLRRFDVVQLSWGAICWMPDLAEWARIVAAHLVDGGVLALFEHHPVWEMLKVAGGQVRVDADYFGRGTPSALRGADRRRMTGWREEVEFASFVWPLADVFTAVRSAGLEVERFQEAPDPEMYDGLGEHAASLPAVYALLARKGRREDAGG